MSGEKGGTVAEEKRLEVYKVSELKIRRELYAEFLLLDHCSLTAA